MVTSPTVGSTPKYTDLTVSHKVTSTSKLNYFQYFNRGNTANVYVNQFTTEKRFQHSLRITQ
jgi:hypothetical protein